jgi:hypothetical protein
MVHVFTDDGPPALLSQVAQVIELEIHRLVRGAHPGEQAAASRGVPNGGAHPFGTTGAVLQ